MCTQQQMCTPQRLCTPPGGGTPQWPCTTVLLDTTMPGIPARMIAHVAATVVHTTKPVFTMLLGASRCPSAPRPLRAVAPQRLRTQHILLQQQQMRATNRIGACAQRNAC
eukprot:308353-Pyramimonas_sp.AAC.1